MRRSNLHTRQIGLPPTAGALQPDGHHIRAVGRIALVALLALAFSMTARTSCAVAARAGSVTRCNSSVVTLAEHRSGVLRPVVCPTSSRITWSESKAEMQVAAKVFFGWQVNNKNWGSYTESVLSVTCRGVGETASFMFSRFDCAIVEGHPGYAFGSQVFPDRPVAKGHIAVYVTGPTTFRWAILD